MRDKDNVKYTHNAGDKFKAVRCPVCDLKRMVTAGKDDECPCGGKEIQKPKAKQEKNTLFTLIEDDDDEKETD